MPGVLGIVLVPAMTAQVRLPENILLCPRSPPCAPLVSFFFFRQLILFKEVFMDFLKRYKKMIALRGLTDHTMKSYCDYVAKSREIPTFGDIIIL